MVARKNEAGERIRLEQRKRFCNGWFENAAGHCFFALRYAGEAIELAKGKNAIAVGELARALCISTSRLAST